MSFHGASDVESSLRHWLSQKIGIEDPNKYLLILIKFMSINNFFCHIDKKNMIFIWDILFKIFILMYL